MYQVQGKNKIGDFESIILDGKNKSEVIIYAKKYFQEIFSIKNVKLKEEKLSEE
jgi:hypothetical protein